MKIKKKLLAVITVFVITITSAFSASAQTSANIADKAAEYLGVMETTYSNGAWNTSFQNWWCDRFDDTDYFRYWAPWCAIFVDYVIDRAGGQVNVDYPSTAGCEEHRAWYDARGLYSPRGSYTPQKGDIIYFNYTNDPSVTSHVGIVWSVGNGKVTTIEGNTITSSDYRYGVRCFEYGLNTWYIKGYARTGNRTSSGGSSSSISNNQSIVSGSTYNIRAKNGYMINVYAGWDWDAVNVCLWQKDGSVEQRFTPRKQANGKWLIYANCSNGGWGRVLDVYRDSGYNLSNNCNIDVYSATDPDAQLVEIVPAGNGYYKIKLASNGMVFKTTGAYNNANIVLGYDDNSDACLFTFEKA